MVLLSLKLLLTITLIGQQEVKFLPEKEKINDILVLQMEKVRRYIFADIQLKIFKILITLL